MYTDFTTTKGVVMSTPNAVAEKFRGSPSISLTVKDIQNSVVWYRDVVGFGIERAVEREGRLVMVAIQAGDVRIHLNQDDGAKGWERIKGLGFSIGIWTAEDIDIIARRIKSCGGKLDSEPSDTPWGARIFRLTDPDGYKLAVMRPLKTQ